jgi:hypothetical protein
MKQTKRKILLLLFITHCSLQFTFAQPTQEWVAKYERPSGSGGTASQMALDKVGNCYVLGTSNVNLGIMVLIKYNCNGDTVWTRSYPEAGNVGVVADSIGNVYITGNKLFNIVTIKYNPAGVQQWVKIYDSGTSDECWDIIMDRNGFIYVVGYSGNQSLIIKYNVNGDTVWTRKYSETNYRFYGFNLVIDNHNNFLLSGRREHIPSSTGFQITMKYDSNAVLRWINNPLENLMISPVETGTDNSGNIFVSGQSFSGNILTIKYDLNGNEVWKRIYDGPSFVSDMPYDLKVDGFGNVILTGVGSSAGNNADYVTIKYDTNGDSLWVRKYNGIGNAGDIAYSLALDDSGNSYVTGRSTGSFSDWDYVTIKYNINGVQQWLLRYPDNSGDGGIGYCVDVDKLNNVYVTGTGHVTGISGYVTIKYSQTVGVVTLSSNLPDKYKLEQNYPNPFNPATKIRYQIIDNNSNVRLTVFDITGKQVAELVNQKQEHGYYEAAFDAGELSSGIYFYKLETEKFTEAKKMVLIR